MFYFITFIFIFYFLIVLNVYSTSLYNKGYDGGREIIIIAPIIIAYVLAYTLYKKEYKIFFYSIFHLPTATLIIGLILCKTYLDLKDKQSSKSKEEIKKAKNIGFIFRTFTKNIKNLILKIKQVSIITTKDFDKSKNGRLCREC